MELLEAGKIVSTHGIHGEMKMDCWVDSPQFLKEIQRLYYEGKPLKVLSARPHKNQLIVAVEGIETIEQAEQFRGKIFYFNREDIELPEDRYYIQDLIGCEVVDLNKNQTIGKVREVLQMPAQDIYVVGTGEDERMIPAVEEFISEINLEEKRIYVRLIEGM